MCYNAFLLLIRLSYKLGLRQDRSLPYIQAQESQHRLCRCSPRACRCRRHSSQLRCRLRLWHRGVQDRVHRFRQESLRMSCNYSPRVCRCRRHSSRFRCRWRLWLHGVQGCGSARESLRDGRDGSFWPVFPPSPVSHSLCVNTFA